MIQTTGEVEMASHTGIAGTGVPETPESQFGIFDGREADFCSCGASHPGKGVVLFESMINLDPQNQV